MAWLVLLCMLLPFIFTYYGVESNASNAFFRKDYTFFPDFQSFYKIHVTQRDWKAAKKRCQLEGAQLFIPENYAEVESVIKLMKEQNIEANFVYVGISDLVSKGQFETLDGRSIHQVYDKWEKGEFNNRHDLHDCLVLSQANMKYDDVDCNGRQRFVCKKKLSTLRWNEQCDLPDISYKYNEDLGKCYKYHDRPLKWGDAYSVCAAEQSYLAVINSQAEADHLVKMTAASSKDKGKGVHDFLGLVHLGFHNKNHEGFTTIKGVRLEDSGYKKWTKGQPDNAGGNEVCGSMLYEGTLNDLDCKYSCFYICEHDIGLLGSSLDERFGSF